MATETKKAHVEKLKQMATQAELLKENESLKINIQSDSEYILQLQQELAEARKQEKLVTQDDSHATKLEKELSESQLHAAQLEKAMQYLRCKLDEANTDKELIGQELLEVQKKDFPEADQDYEKLEAEVEQLKENIVSHMRLTKELSEECSEWPQKEKEYEKKIEELKWDLKKQENEKESQSSKIENLERSLVMTKEKSVLEKTIIDQQLKKIEAEKEHLQEQLNKESKNLEKEASDFEKRVEEIAELLEKEREKFEQVEKEVHDGKREKEKVEEKLAKSKKEVEKLNQRLKESQERENTLQKRFEDEDKKTDDDKKANETLRKQLSEKESEIKVAQQHLGKKVKEYTIANDRYEEQKRVNAELQSRLNTTQNKISEIGLAMQQKQDQIKKLEEQKNEMTQSHILYSKKMDEQIGQYKYRVQDLEREVTELQKVRDKFRKMELLLSEGTPQSIPPQREEIKPLPPPPPQREVPPPPAPSDLFGKQPPGAAYKQNLFEE